MTVLTLLTLQYNVAEQQLTAFKSWFSSRSFFTETEVVTELKKYDHLCLLIGMVGQRIKPDHYKHELTIGSFRADFVTTAPSGLCTFVEFEGGQANSLFTKGTKQMRNWSSQMQHGFSQLSDWTWAMNDLSGTDTLENALGFRHLIPEYVLVCGRDSTLQGVERGRLIWRHRTTNIGGSKILFYTYDGLMNHFEGEMDLWRDALVQTQNAP